MKKTILLTCVFLCTSIGIWAQEEPTSITLSQNEIADVSADGKEGETIAVTANGAWTAIVSDEGASWIEVTPTSGDGNGEVTVKVKKNDSPDKRSGDVTFKIDDDTSAILTITQLGQSLPANIELSRNEMTDVPADGNEGETITITASGAWEAVISDDGTGWIEVTPTSGDGNGEVTVKVKKNDSPDKRSGTVTFKISDEIYTELNISQKGQSYITINPQQVGIISWEGDKVAITVDSNEKWEANSTENWIKTAKKDDKTLEIIVDKNESREDREGSVVFTAGTETCTLIISQKGQPFIEITPKEYDVISEEGDKVTIIVDSNVEWDAESSEDWIKTAKKDDKTLEIIVDKNESREDREGTVVFTAGTETCSLIISQKGLPYIEISNPDDYKNITEDGMSIDIMVESNRDWIANKIPDWIIMKKEGKAGKTALNITIEENPDTTKREAAIIFVADKAKQALVITQIGQPFVRVKSGLVDLNDVSEKGKDKIGIKVESNVNWNVSSTPDWISAEKTSPTELSISIAPNPYATERKTVVTLLIDKNPLEITISQNGAKYEINDKGWENSVELKDANNSTNKLEEGIRSGNTLQLPKEKMKPQMKGVGVDYYKWEYEYNWSLDNKSFNGDNASIPNVNTKTVIKLECKAVLKDPSGTIVDSQTIYSRDVVVYPKPSASLSLQQKGDGTSNTWIVQNFKKSENERVVIGLYNETSNSVTYKDAISEYSNGVGWIKLSLGGNGSEKPCICIVRDYGNDVKITSDVYLENGTKSWDGSTYTKLTETLITRGGSDATSIESVANSDQMEEPTSIYSINGTQTNKMVRGMNIIRMKDGSVRKVFVK